MNLRSEKGLGSGALIFIFIMVFFCAINAVGGFLPALVIIAAVILIPILLTACLLFFLFKKEKKEIKDGT